MRRCHFVPYVVLTCIFGNSFYKPARHFLPSPPLPPPCSTSISRDKVSGGSVQPVIQASKVESR